MTRHSFGALLPPCRLVNACGNSEAKTPERADDRLGKAVPIPTPT